LAPGATANAVLRQADPSVYPPSQCGPVTSAHLQVYPPNTTQAAEIPFSGPTCSHAQVDELGIGAVVSGADN